MNNNGITYDISKLATRAEAIRYAKTVKRIIDVCRSAGWIVYLVRTAEGEQSMWRIDRAMIKDGYLTVSVDGATEAVTDGDFIRL